MADYDLGYIHNCLAQPQGVGTTTALGMRLQDLVEYLFSKLEGASVEARNAFNAARSEEKDLWIQHAIRVSDLPFSDPLFPIECKNEEDRASSEEVSRFETKIRNSGGSDGLFFARTGLAGQDAHRAAHDAIHQALSHGIRIVVVIGEDLRHLQSTDDLKELLVRRYTELRILQTYSSI